MAALSIEMVKIVQAASCTYAEAPPLHIYSKRALTHCFVMLSA